MSWRNQAACNDADPDLFTGDDLSPAVTDKALAYCATCPVLNECKLDTQNLLTMPMAEEGTYEVQLRGVFGGEVFLHVEDEVLALFQEGLTRTQIAEATGIDGHKVASIVDEHLGEEHSFRRAITERGVDLRERVIEVWDSGEHNLTIIGERVGVSRTTVRKLLAELGLREPPPTKNPVDHEAIARRKARVHELADTGLSARAIARELGVDKETVRRDLNGAAA